MNIDKRIEDLRKEFDNKIDQLKKEYQREKNGKWIPNYGEEYFFLNARLQIYNDNNYEYEEDKNAIKYNKVFKTYKEAQEYADYLKAKKEYSYEFSKEEWENTNIYKYYIYYDFDDKAFYIGSAEYCGRIGTYFKTAEKAQEFIDKYKRQILKFEFGIEE